MGPGRRLMRDLMDLDPIRAIGRIENTAYLAVFGDKDSDVPQNHVSLLRSAFAMRQNAKHRLQLLAGADHQMKMAESAGGGGAASAGGADIRRPLHADFIALIGSFLKETNPPSTLPR